MEVGLIGLWSAIAFAVLLTVESEGDGPPVTALTGNKGLDIGQHLTGGCPLIRLMI
jgi:hypothetical protein